MGLASDLGYSFRSPNWSRRLIARLFALKPMSWVSYHVGHRLDKAVLKLTNGKTTFTAWVTGLPVIWVVTTGAKSGLKRTVPLLGVPIGDDLALLGSGFGQEKTPGWVHNLEANPFGSVVFGDRTKPVEARPADEFESDQVWTTARDVYSGYQHYQSRADHREIRVFILEAR